MVELLDMQDRRKGRIQEEVFLAFSFFFVYSKLYGGSGIVLNLAFFFCFNIVVVYVKNYSAFLKYFLPYFLPNITL